MLVAAGVRAEQDCFAGARQTRVGLLAARRTGAMAPVGPGSPPPRVDCEGRATREAESPGSVSLGQLALRTSGDFCTFGPLYDGHRLSGLQVTEAPTALGRLGAAQPGSLGLLCSVAGSGAGFHGVTYWVPDTGHASHLVRVLSFIFQGREQGLRPERRPPGSRLWGPSNRVVLPKRRAGGARVSTLGKAWAQPPDVCVRAHTCETGETGVVRKLMSR